MASFSHKSSCVRLQLLKSGSRCMIGSLPMTATNSSKVMDAVAAIIRIGGGLLSWADPGDTSLVP